MPLITRTVSKGIPPRVRSPPGKGKKKATVGKRKEKRKKDDHDKDSEISKHKKGTGNPDNLPRARSRMPQMRKSQGSR